MKRLSWSHDLGKIGDTTFVQPMVLALPSFFRYLFGAWNVRSDLFRFSSFGVHDHLDQAMDSRLRGNGRHGGNPLRPANPGTRAPDEIGASAAREGLPGPPTPGMRDARRAWRGATLVPHCGYERPADPARAEARARDRPADAGNRPDSAPERLHVVLIRHEHEFGVCLDPELRRVLTELFDRLRHPCSNRLLDHHPHDP